MSQQALRLDGCRHDILGHYLKAIGLLRVLARCADPKHRDTTAEGWWGMEQACFFLRSTKYPTIESIIGFFEKHYTPTPVMAAWNKETGASKDDGFASSVWDIAEKHRLESISGNNKQEKASSAQVFQSFRDDPRHDLAEALDAIAAPRLCQGSNNPVFLTKGIAGRAHLFRSYWDYLRIIDRLRNDKKKTGFKPTLISSLTGRATGKVEKGKGTPFFPDAIKSFNTGTSWVQEKYPFNGFDYVLATEGALALRGSVARAVGAQSKRFAAFPFVFDSGEDMVDDGNETKGTAPSLWFPLWERGTTFAELASFIGDSQARLPQKEARFSSEFVRALYAQGVDAGFSGWQEFRYKMKGSRVPWITTGRYVEAQLVSNAKKQCSTRSDATLLNRGLEPIDASMFLEQFDIARNGSKVDPRSPHRVRAEINEAIEDAMYEPTPQNCLAVLGSIFHGCRQMCISDSFRKKLPSQRATFFKPLPTEEWEELLRPLEHSAEYRIARAVASIKGRQRQTDGTDSIVEPILGSMLPLTLKSWGWSLPEKKDHTHQDVWTGSDLPLDLAAVLRRRYMDSLKDDKPAVQATFGAKLQDVLRFLGGSLDDHLISRWIEAMSLIGWQTKRKAPPAKNVDEIASQTASPRSVEPSPDSVEFTYAALRTLLELECEWQGSDKTQWKKRRSQQPFALLFERSASSVQWATSEALRWISIWGVPNPWGIAATAEKSRVAGRYIIRTVGSLPSTVSALSAGRLAAAVCIPLQRSDLRKIYQSVTIPPGA
jgi:CRISPR-associated protein Csx17